MMSRSKWPRKNKVLGCSASAAGERKLHIGNLTEPEASQQRTKRERSGEDSGGEDLKY